MPEKRDYYDVLGVDRGADSATIKKAFRRLAREHHPDVNQSDPAAAQRFKELGEAYAVLGDDRKRAQYDQYGHLPENGSFGPGEFNADMFGDLAGVFSAFFGMGSGGFGQQGPANGPQRGDSLVLPVDLTLEEVATGCDREISYRRQSTCPICFGTGAAEGASPERCPTCEGHGQVRQQRRTLLGLTTVLSACPECRGAGTIVRNPCGRCRGEGRVQESVERTVKLPAGVDEGMRIKVAGGGDTGRNGGPAGDLHLHIRIRRHESFERDGMNVFCEQPISFPQAALGDTIEVPGLLEPQTLQIPAGTQTGETFRIVGAGLPSVRSQHQRGDQYVVARVVTPTELDEEQKELLFRFAHASGEDGIEPEERGFFDRVLSALRRK